jgi:hypothetical protein
LAMLRQSDFVAGSHIAWMWEPAAALVHGQQS